MDDISSIDAVLEPTSSRPRRVHRRARSASVLLAATLVATTALVGCSGGDDGQATPMPEVTLVDLADEQPAELPTGTPTVVNFWASWCAPCRAEMPAFQEVADQMGDQVAVVGITDEDDLDAAREAAEASGVSYPLLVDTDQTLLTDLAIVGLPGTVFLDEDGNVVGKHLGAMDEAELTAEIEDRYGITP